MVQGIEEVESNTFDRVWKVVEEIGEEERHFNELQARYRNMASAWLLATFAAMGFVGSNTNLLNIEKELLVAGIAAAGATGIALLWVIDLLVYHRLLNSCFIEGLVLEEKHPWLPPVRNNMMKTQRGEGVWSRVVGFYIAPVVLLIVLAGGSLSLRVGQEHWVYAVVCIVVTIAGGTLAAYSMRKNTDNTATFGKWLAQSREQS